MLDIKDTTYFNAVLAFACKVGAAEKLLDQLAYLSHYGHIGEPVAPFTPEQRDERLAWIVNKPNSVAAKCELYPDFSPYSFEFLMKRADGSNWFNGGLIYSGPGQPLDGSFPALTVGIGIDDSVHGWSIHT